jgi:hypothetical protein
MNDVILVAVPIMVAAFLETPTIQKYVNAPFAKQSIYTQIQR